MFIKDLGMKYPNENSKTKRRHCLLSCDTCEKEFTSETYVYKKREIKVCPKCASEVAGGKRVKHGCVGTRLYNIWLLMRNRCNNPNYDGYANYGGRGVTVCNEWDDFTLFKKWSMDNGYNKELSIDKDIMIINEEYIMYGESLETPNFYFASKGDTYSLAEMKSVFITEVGSVMENPEFGNDNDITIESIFNEKYYLQSDSPAIDSGLSNLGSIYRMTFDKKTELPPIVSSLSDQNSSGDWEIGAYIYGIIHQFQGTNLSGGINYP